MPSAVTFKKELIPIVVTSLTILLFSCNHFKKNSTHLQVPDSNISKGKVLAATYCQSCHLLPDPSQLDSKNWELGVLPAMGPRLGIFDFGLYHYPVTRNDPNIGKDFYPSRPVLSLGDWQCIIDYYASLSPDSLPAQQRDYPIDNGNALFKIEIPSFRKNIPATCSVKIDTTIGSHQLFATDMISKNIYRFDNRLRLLDSFHCNSPAIDLEIFKDNIIACNIGIMTPNDGKSGSVQLITKHTGELKVDTTMYFDKLARPVQVVAADLNKDGKMDYLVCEFGNLKGALSWMESLGNNQFKYNILRQEPGAIKAYVTDINHDGLPDICVLFAQGEEGIFLYTNLGNGKFAQKEILRFPPINGSSYFEMADFNKDGFPDIVYTCGDNADYSAILKPYHGVYIFMNDGKNDFRQQYFFPINGCFKAVARDFDNDGDIDLAAISFFADYVHQPEEGFVYLQNTGKMDFHPYSIAGTTVGRWLTMDAGDIDGDGMIDLVLGNFSIAPSFIQPLTDWKLGPPFIILKNIMP
ncbi:MAG: repeat-containing protein [Ferruginibacter sp.]|nr:repeat-containing protein [Ferruginibacter sp.]